MGAGKAQEKDLSLDVRTSGDTEMKMTVLTILMALAALCAFAMADETAEDWAKTGDELYENGSYEEAASTYDKAHQFYKESVGHNPEVSASVQPEEVWNKTYGGSDIDWGATVEAADDGGYIIVGITKSYGIGDGDAWLVKTDAEGNEQWNKTFGGVKDDGGYSIQDTIDGGYIITGYTESYGSGNADVWLIKTDSEGEEEWSRVFGGQNRDMGMAIQETKDNGYIITGYTYSYGSGLCDVWLIKTDAGGNEQWNKTFGGLGVDLGNTIQEADDCGYLIAGRTESYGSGSSDAWLIKTDSYGNEVWNRTYGGSEWDSSNFVQRTNDGGYIIVGNTQSYGVGAQDIWLIKVDSSGTEQWNKTFGGSFNEWGFSVRQTEDSGFMIVGNTESYGSGNCDAWLIKTDSEGNEVWERTFGGKGTDGGHSAQETIDGYIILGSTNSYKLSGSDTWLIKLRAATPP